MQRVIDAKLQGSRVVVFFTDAESTKSLLSELGRFYEAAALKPGDIIMVGLGDWARDVSIVQGLEKVALGSLIFKEEHGKYPVPCYWRSIFYLKEIVVSKNH